MSGFLFKNLIIDSKSNIMEITDNNGNSITFDRRFELYLENRLRTDVENFMSSRSPENIYIWDIDNSEFKSIHLDDVFSLKSDGKIFTKGEKND